MKDSYEHDYKQLAKLKEFSWSYDDYKHWRTIVSSRVFGISKSSNSFDCLIPFVDFINHSETRNVNWNYNSEKGYFRLTAKEGIEKNQEIVDNYGKKSNERLLITYGFVVKNNIFDNYVVSSIELAELAVDAADILKSKNAVLVFKKDVDDEAFINSLDLARLLVMNIKEIEKYVYR